MSLLSPSSSSLHILVALNLLELYVEFFHLLKGMQAQVSEFLVGSGWALTGQTKVVENKDRERWCLFLGRAFITMGEFGPADTG